MSDGFTGTSVIRNLPTGDGREDLIVCPKDHVIRNFKDAGDFSQTFVLECDGNEYARIKIHAVNSYDEIDHWATNANKDHLINYLRSVIKDLKQEGDADARA